MIRFSALLVVLLSGCVGNDGLGSLTRSEINISKISKLSIGMNQYEVLEMMRQPYRRELFELNEATYEVWFYITKPTVLGQTRMVPQNLTPLTFKNGELIGWGFAYYNYLVQKEDELERPRLPEKRVNEEEELQKALERAFKPTPGSKPVEQNKKALPANGSQTTPKVTPQNKGISPGSVPKKDQPTIKEAKQPTTLKKGAGKTETLKIDKMTPPDKNQPDKQKKEKFHPPEKPDSQYKKLSMSSSPKKPNSPPPSKPEKPSEKKPLIDPEDEEMLEDAQDQNFNQT